MKFNILSVVLLAIGLSFAGCTDDDLIVEHGGGTDTDSHLHFAVNSFSVDSGDPSRSAEPSPEPEKETPEEAAIHDFWLFQFNTSGNQLAAPRYYTIPTDGNTLEDLTAKAYADLTRNTPMTVYVVTNTGSPTWVTGTGFDTLSKVKEQKIPLPFPIQVGTDDDGDGVTDEFFIPMSGQVDNVTVKDKSYIEVPVTRMYAKVKIQAKFAEQEMRLYYAEIKGIPWYCTVSAQSNGMSNGEPAAVPFPAGTEMISRAFTSSKAIEDEKGNKWLTIYIPENIRGEISGADKAAGTNIPENALTVKIRTKFNGTDYYYTVYPGENKVNNFNVRRNCVYRVSLDVVNVRDQHNPSSNCYVVKPGELLSFEPYNRAEIGGGYDIRNYLNPDNPNKKIASVKIIWQTQDCIGDNTNGDKAWLGPATTPITNQKVYVRAGKEGNALIGAYDSTGKNILWSWHIWVTDKEPDNIANAIIYTTYSWDDSGIHNDRPRVPGYCIMPCNIGALEFRSGDMNSYSIQPKNKFPEDQIRTFGMLYQWGRKDPFPPMIYSTGTEDANGTLAYNDEYTGNHYANDNRTLVHKTSNYTTSYLFHTKVNTDIGWNTTSVQYGIAHPTVYISGSVYDWWNQPSYNNGGDWCKNGESDDRLWGAAEKIGKGLSIDNGKAHLYNNYGEKSIFDPCPEGWRVPPPDLWLGFSKTGVNPKNYLEVNYCEAESGKRPGLSMYVRAFGSGPTVYFPLQGVRIHFGNCQNTGLCGNYHNATCDQDNRVNILHLHRDMTKASTGYSSMLFKIFEYDTNQYYAKSTAGPIRCVRDTK